MTRTTLQITVITALAIASYYGLSNLPDTRCNFLHYELNAVTDDGIELCETDASGFFDLEVLRYPVALDLSIAAPLQVGQTTSIALRLLGPGGTPLLPHELAITHTRRMHLLVVDPSLNDYHHIHPESLGPDGEWSWTFTPRRSGLYKIYAEMVPVRTRRKVIAVGSLSVPGTPEAPQIGNRLYASVDGYRFDLEIEAPAALRIWQDHTMRLKVRSQATSQPVVLQTVMDAYGHMVAFDSQSRGFAHMHPLPNSSETDPSEAEVAFTFNTGHPGPYRLWAQVKIDGRQVFAPFDLQFKDETL